MNEDANAAADAEMNERRLHTEGAEVEVLVAGDAADARLPPPVLVVPALASTTTNSQMKTPGKSESFSECSAVKKSTCMDCSSACASVCKESRASDLVTPRYMDAPREKPLLFLHPNAHQLVQMFSH